MKWKSDIVNAIFITSHDFDARKIRQTNYVRPRLEDAEHVHKPIGWGTPSYVITGS